VQEKPDGARSVKSAERVLDLLEHIGTRSQGVTFGAIARELSIPKSSLHALLEVLTNRGYVELAPETRHYSLGTRVWETGQAYLLHHNVVREARAVLESIVARVNETAQLAKLAGTENVYLAKVDSSHALRLQSEVGARLSAHATGVGKALLAQLDDAEIYARFGRGNLPAYTRNTFSTTQALVEELAEIRRRGFAIDNEEYTPGVFCIAVPVYDASERATTAVSVSVPTMRAESEGLALILHVVAEGSLQLSARCGARRVDPVLNRLADPAHARAAIEALVNSSRYNLPFAADKYQAVR